MKNFLLKMIQEQINLYYNYFYVQWHITPFCTEQCKHCYMKEEIYNITPDLVGKMYDVINSIKETASKRGLKPFIAFTGGDPLLCEDLFSLIEHANSQNISVVIKGNPRLLDDARIEKLSKLGIQSYHLSIDGNKETHDNIRSEGSFEITLNALKRLKLSGIKTLVKYTVNSINYTDLNDTISTLNELGVDFFDFARFCPNSRDDYKYMLSATEYKQFLIETLKYYQSLIKKDCNIRLLFRDHLWFLLFRELGVIDEKYLAEISSRDKIICGCSMGSNNALVFNYNGDVLPCAKIPNYIIGNIFSDKLENIITTQKLKMLSCLASYEGCLNCNLASFCRGCPAISNAVHGSVFDKDPQCWKV